MIQTVPEIMSVLTMQQVIKAIRPWLQVREKAYNGI